MNPSYSSTLRHILHTSYNIVVLRRLLALQQWNEFTVIGMESTNGSADELIR